jgi:hypothetical protein
MYELPDDTVNWSPRVVVGRLKRRPGICRTEIGGIGPVRSPH